MLRVKSLSTRPPFVEIIIPNWNGAEFLKECLDSLKKQTFSDFGVVVVDNGSTDGSLDMLAANYPEVRTISFENNRGFSAAVNAGIHSSNSRWLLLLNNDIEVAPDCLETLAEAVERYPGYHSFSLKMVNYHHRDMLDGAGDAVLRGGAGYRIGTMERDQGQYDEDRDVFGPCAGAALYSREFFDKTGYFDEDFFAYLEDVDLNMRAVRQGLRCRYVAGAVVYHIGSATSGSRINPFTISLSTKNTFNVLLKNYPISVFLRFFPIICIYHFMWFLFVLKRKEVMAYLKGITGAAGQVHLMLKKRRTVATQATISPKEFAQLLNRSERDAVNSIMFRRTQMKKTNRLLSLYQKIFLG